MLRSQRAIAITFELASFGSMETQFHTKVCIVQGSNGWPFLSDFPRGMDGIFFIDFIVGVGGLFEWTAYMAEVLYEVWRATGMHCAVIHSDHFRDGPLPGPEYSWLQSLYWTHFYGTYFVVWICMDSVINFFGEVGRETWTQYWPVHVRQIQDACSYLFQQGRPYMPRMRMVYGGNTAIRTGFSGLGNVRGQAEYLYELGVELVVEHCRIRNPDVLSSDGYGFLNEIVFGQHGMYGQCSVSLDQLRKVSSAFIVMTRWSMSPPRSKL